MSRHHPSHRRGRSLAAPASHSASSRLALGRRPAPGQRGVERQDHAGAARELRERIGQLAGGNLIRARRTGGGSRCGLRPGGGHAGGKRARASSGQHGDAAGGQRGAQTRMS
ncbi:hypothetical protein G6F57_017956 [Rhizopus arrhizus]|nr:hypothetical protein G6F57_017956 [Rhizopus arrhizus]